MNWDEVTVCWSVGEQVGSESAGGTVTISDFFSDFPDDLEMKVSVWIALDIRTPHSHSEVAGPNCEARGWKIWFR